METAIACWALSFWVQGDWTCMSWICKTTRFPSSGRRGDGAKVVCMHPPAVCIGKKEFGFTFLV